MTTGISVPIPDNTCPACGSTLDMSFVANADEPEQMIAPDDGSFSICIRCSAVSIFRDGKMEHPTHEERIDFFTDPERIEILVSVLLAMHHELTS